MGYRGKQPVILENLVSVSLSQLRELKLFDKREGYRSMPILIKKANGLCIHTYTLQVTVSVQSGNTYVEFSCEIDQQAVSCRIPLVQVPNHLTNQFTYYFQCNEAGKKSRVLFLFRKKFVSREAIPNRYYLRDTLSKRNRVQYETMKRLHSLERAVKQCGRKNFTPYRYGQQTIRMRKAALAKSELDRMKEAFLC